MKEPCLIMLLFCLLSGITYAQVPVIKSFSPTFGPAGTLVTITGSLNSSVNNNIVFFGGVKAAVSSANTNTIQVKVPVGATYQPISVLNTASHLAGYAVNPFNITFSGSHKIFTTQFDAGLNIPAGVSPRAVKLLDLDMDGKLDMFVLNANSNTISVYKNKSKKGSIDKNSFEDKADLKLIDYGICSNC